MIQKRIDAKESDIDRLEGVGAMNFLALDDLMMTQEGEPIDPLSVITGSDMLGRLLRGVTPLREQAAAGT